MVDTAPEFKITDGTGPVTVDGTVTANLGTIGDAATEATLAAVNSKLNSLGQKASADSVPVVLPSDQDPIPVILATNPTSFTFGDVTQIGRAHV